MPRPGEGRPRRGRVLSPEESAALDLGAAAFTALGGVDGIIKLGSKLVGSPHKFASLAAAYAATDLAVDILEEDKIAHETKP